MGDVTIIEGREEDKTTTEGALPDMKIEEDEKGAGGGEKLLSTSRGQSLGTVMSSDFLMFFFVFLDVHPYLRSLDVIGFRVK